MVPPSRVTMSRPRPDSWLLQVVFRRGAEPMPEMRRAWWPRPAGRPAGRPSAQRAAGHRLQGLCAARKPTSHAHGRHDNAALISRDQLLRRTRCPPWTTRRQLHCRCAVTAPKVFDRHTRPKPPAVAAEARTGRDRADRRSSSSHVRAVAVAGAMCADVRSLPFAAA